MFTVEKVVSESRNKFCVLWGQLLDWALADLYQVRTLLRVSHHSYHLQHSTLSAEALTTLPYTQASTPCVTHNVHPIYPPFPFEPEDAARMLFFQLEKLLSG